MRVHPVLLFGAILGCTPAPLQLPQPRTLRIRGAVLRDARPPGTLYRDEVQGAIQDGLGHFLQKAELRPVTRLDDAGRRVFVGFEIVSLRPALAWLNFDFAPGDVITNVDGVSVEHYDSVVPMFEGLASKQGFDVSLIRGDEQRRVTIRIRERDVGTTPAEPKRVTPEKPVKATKAN